MEAQSKHTPNTSTCFLASWVSFQVIFSTFQRNRVFFSENISYENKYLENINIWTHFLKDPSLHARREIYRGQYGQNQLDLNHVLDELFIQRFDPPHICPAEWEIFLFCFSCSKMISTKMARFNMLIFHILDVYTVNNQDMRPLRQEVFCHIHKV